MRNHFTYSYSERWGWVRKYPNGSIVMQPPPDNDVPEYVCDCGREHDEWCEFGGCEDIEDQDE